MEDLDRLRSATPYKSQSDYRLVRKLDEKLESVRWKHVRWSIGGAMVIAGVLLALLVPRFSQSQVHAADWCRYVIIQLCFPPQYDTSTYNQALRNLERRMEERRAKMVGSQFGFDEFGNLRMVVGEVLTKAAAERGEEYDRLMIRRREEREKRERERNHRKEL